MMSTCISRWSFGRFLFGKHLTETRVVSVADVMLAEVKDLSI